MPAWCEEHEEGGRRRMEGRKGFLVEGQGANERKCTCKLVMKH